MICHIMSANVMKSFNEWKEAHPEVKELDKQQQLMLYDEYTESLLIYAGDDPEMD